MYVLFWYLNMLKPRFLKTMDNSRITSFSKEQCSDKLCIPAKRADIGLEPGYCAARGVLFQANRARSSMRCVIFSVESSQTLISNKLSRGTKHFTNSVWYSNIRESSFSL